MTTKIIGLTKPVDMPERGVSPAFHVISSYHVDVANKLTIANLASFMKPGLPSPIGQIQVQLAGKPVAGDAEQWIYAEIAANTSEQNVLAACTKVMGDVQ